MSLRINRKILSAPVKLKDARKKISDSISEDTHLREGLTKQLKDLGSDIKKSNQELNLKKIEVESVQAILDSKKEELNGLEKGLNTLKFQFEYESDRTEKIKTNTANTIKETECAQQKTINDNKVVISQQEKDINRMAKDIKDLEIKYKETDNKTNNIAKLLEQKQVEFNNLSKVVEDLKGSKNNLQIDIEGIQKKINEEKRIFDELLKEKKGTLQKIETELSSKIKEIDKFNLFIVKKTKEIELKDDEQNRTEERQNTREKFLKGEADRIDKRAKALQKYFDQHDIKLTVK